MAKNQELIFLQSTILGLTDLIKRTSENAARHGLEHSMVYDDITELFEMLKESFLELIEKYGK